MEPLNGHFNELPETKDGQHKSEKFLGISILGGPQTFLNFTPRKPISPSR